MRKSFYLSTMACAAVIALSGCAVNRPVDVPNIKPSPIKLVEPKKTIGLSAQDEELLVQGADIGAPLALDAGDPLPDLAVPTLTFSNARAVDVLDAISQATGVPITFVDESDAVKGRKVSVRNLSRHLPQLMTELSDLLGFFYTYENGTLKVTSGQQYIVPVPPVNDLMASLPQMVSHLGATQVFLDKSSRTLTYEASKAVNKRVSAYLKYVRDNSSLIVYDVYIWDVSLSDASAMGIKWNQLQFGFGPMGPKGTRIGSNNITGGSLGGDSAGALGGASSSGGLGTEIVYSGSTFSLDVLLNFLKTQGTVTAISQPRLALVSGGTAQFEDGQTIQYVSRMGAVVGTNTTLSSSETDSIFTGLQMGMSGDVSDGTVFSDVNVSLGQLIRFNSFASVDGSTQQLPQTSTQQVKTKVRARSGDTILLAGVNTIQYSGNKTGIPGLPGTGSTMLTSTDNSNARRELVMVLQPRVIKFKHAGASELKPASAPVMKDGAADAPKAAAPDAAGAPAHAATPEEIEAKAKAIAAHADTSATE